MGKPRIKVITDLVPYEGPDFEQTRRGSMPEMVLGGAIEGAERTKRETINWQPSRLSPDQAINTVKPEADARATDLAINDGLTQHAVRVNKNSIVGAQYRLNAKPDYRVIYGADSKAAQEYGEELASVAEARFNLAAESENCYFDAGGMMTFTDQVRLVVGSCALSGEAFGAVEWEDHDLTRPFKTCIQMVAPARVSNKNNLADDNLPNGFKRRRGIITNRNGKPFAFEVRKGHPSEWYDMSADEWITVPAQLDWGRKQMLFIREALQIDQTRGLSEMVAALSHIRMTKKFSEVTLQNAVINASYAAAIESDLPSPEIVAAMGGGPEGLQKALGTYMSMLQSYLAGSENIAIDGAKVPQFFPGTKMKLTPMGTPGGIGSDFQASLIRHVALTLGLSPADLSRDFARVNYSGLKGELAIAERDTSVRKKAWADRWATGVYRLWFEEEMGAGNLPLPPGRNRTDFYRPLMKDAYTRCSWIGSGRGQIDEPKETAAALARIDGGLSTYEDEAGRLGKDYREIIAQRAKEERQIAAAGVVFLRSSAQATLIAASEAADRADAAQAAQDAQPQQDQQQ
jgi:lambda family phage portal protein